MADSTRSSLRADRLAPQLILVLALCACGDAHRVDGADPSPATDAALDASSQGMDGSSGNGGPFPTVVAEPDDEAAYLYDQSALRTYELVLPAENLAALDVNPAAEQYVEGMLRFEGHDYGPVGIRYKGSVGGFIGCLAFPGIGPKICTKLSMKVSFNWRDPELRFYGLKKLQFHAMNRDPSMLKERLGYALFREAGIAAPRAVHARVLINGQLVGLFALVEQIDGRFTDSRFTDGGDGNLYKEAWPVDYLGFANPDAVLRPTLETNEDENPSLQGMADFGAALEQAGEDGLTEAIEKYTDVDYMMRYVALDRLLRHDDGPMHWYCSGPRCSNHNFYWYQEEKADRFWIVTWDLDSAFNLSNTTTTLWFDWDDTSLGCQALSMPPFVLPIRHPTCDPLTRGWAREQERYLAETEALLEGSFDASRVEAKLEAWEEQMAPLVQEASDAHFDAVAPAAWHDATAALRDTIATLRARAEERVARGAIEITNPHLPKPMDAGTEPVEDAAVIDASTKDAGVMDASADAEQPTTDEDAGE